MSEAANPPSHAGVLDIHVRRHVVDARMVITVGHSPVTALFGPSGAGKTTVLRALAGLSRTSGHVRFGDQVWDDGRTFVPPRHRHVGYLFQDHALFPHLDVRANVTYGLRRLPRAQRRARAEEALAAVNAAHLTARSVGQLSGGEAQRVALARALAPRPQLLLLDEPLSALDTPTRLTLRRELRQVLVEQAVPTILVTHDRAEALALADQVVVLVDGTVRQVGPVAEVFDRPVDEAVMRVVGTETAVAGVVRASTADGVEVLVGSTTVVAAPLPGIHSPGATVMVGIRAEDVALQDAHAPRSSSHRNLLAGVVTDVLDEGALVRVEVDVGFRLSAYVTRSAAHDLELMPGRRVITAVKAQAVHLVERAGGGVNLPSRSIS